MSDIESRYFWCDKPSPMHDKLGEILQERRAAIAAAHKVARGAGAKEMVFSRDRGGGVVFSKGHKVESRAWVEKGFLFDGTPYYMPRRNSANRKVLAKRITDTRIPSVQDVLNDFKLNTSVVGTDQGRMVLQFSGLGYKDGRIFVRIPVSGDSEDKKSEFPKIPDFLTECKKWEYERWFSEGRKGVEAAA